MYFFCTKKNTRSKIGITREWDRVSQKIGYLDTSTGLCGHFLLLFIVWKIFFRPQNHENKNCNNFHQKNMVIFSKNKGNMCLKMTRFDLISMRNHFWNIIMMFYESKTSKQTFPQLVFCKMIEFWIWLLAKRIS